MIRLTDLLNENTTLPAYEELVSAIKPFITKYKNFGLRVLTTSISVKEGDKLRNSTQWTYSGEDSGLSLGGVSTIGIFSLSKKDINQAVQFIKGYNTKDTQLILVGGPLAKRGQDPGELIIKDGIALKIWK